MVTIIKPVYYCEHCGKRLLSKKWMIIHEYKCTKNPNRTCKICQAVGNTHDIKQVIKNYPHHKDGNIFLSNEELEQIRKEVNGCPCCILTVIRCDSYMHSDFNFKKESEAYYKLHFDEIGRAYAKRKGYKTHDVNSEDYGEKID